MEIHLIGLSGRIKSGKDSFARLLQLAMLYEGKSIVPSEQTISGAVNNLHSEIWLTAWKIKKFAGTLKLIVCLLTGCTMTQLEDQEFKEQELPECWDRTIIEAREWLVLKYYKHGSVNSQLEHLDDSKVKSQALQEGFKFKRTYREMLQELGTNVFREHFHPQTWVNALFSGYKEDDNWIITDARFPDEANAIKEHKGIVIRINRYPDTLMYQKAGSELEEIPFDPTNKQYMDLWLADCNRAHASETALDKYQQFDEIIDNSGTLVDLYEKAVAIVQKYKLKP